MNPIRRLRSQAGLTQSQLGALAGTSQPTIALYEAGEKSPTLATLERLARAANLQVSVSFVPDMTPEDSRSLAYHAAVIEKLKANPTAVITKARKNLGTLAALHPHARELLDRWKKWLSLPVDELIARCLDGGWLSRDMRQVTPFAGILTAKERAKIIKEMRRQK